MARTEVVTILAGSTATKPWGFDSDTATVTVATLDSVQNAGSRYLAVRANDTGGDTGVTVPVGSQVRIQGRNYGLARPLVLDSKARTERVQQMFGVIAFFQNASLPYISDMWLMPWSLADLPERDLTKWPMTAIDLSAISEVNAWAGGAYDTIGWMAADGVLADQIVVSNQAQKLAVYADFTEEFFSPLPVNVWLAATARNRGINPDSAPLCRGVGTRTRGQITIPMPAFGPSFANRANFFVFGWQRRHAAWEAMLELTTPVDADVPNGHAIGLLDASTPSIPVWVNSQGERTTERLIESGASVTVGTLKTAEWSIDLPADIVVGSVLQRDDGTQYAVLSFDRDPGGRTAVITGEILEVQ